ncbi:MAG: 16S rRNA (uracil(1498)-N(3))-methyltransferase [Rhizobiaceae bacterium]|nr:16S rRNA (uracil(1498)-N(3))-methyltransferase [Rhizobiaceae bacterium]
MERYDYKTQRLFVESDLQKDAVISLEKSHANYLLNVLRMKERAEILLFNGRQGEWLGEITNARRKACDIVLLRCTRQQPAPSELVYLFAPLKKGRLDYMVQKAVEMGAGTLQPVITAHTQFTKLNLNRLRANVIEAAEQCGILSVASLNEPVKLDDLLADWDNTRTIIYCDEATQNDETAKRLRDLKGKKLAVLIGPEGGFSDAERQRLRKMDCVLPISLGPRILRADTAAVAALALVQANAGDW